MSVNYRELEIKADIWETVLEHAKGQQNLYPSDLAKNLINARKLIDEFKLVEKTNESQKED